MREGRRSVARQPSNYGCCCTVPVAVVTSALTMWAWLGHQAAKYPPPTVAVTVVRFDRWIRTPVTPVPAAPIHICPPQLPPPPPSWEMLPGDAVGAGAVAPALMTWCSGLLRQDATAVPELVGAVTITKT
jgi:hypothetical protein